MKLTIVGAGMGSLDMVTCEGIDAIEGASLVLAPPRMGEDFKELNKNILSMNLGEMYVKIEECIANKESLVVLATGDASYHSIGTLLYKKYSDACHVQIIPGISSLSYICSRLGYSYSNMKLVSLHGTDKSLVSHVVYNKMVFALTGGKTRAHDVVSELLQFGITDVKVTIGENLSYPEEVIVQGSPKELAHKEFSDLAVMIVENPSPVDRYRTLRDDDFIRGDAPMTKEGIRNLSLASLEIRPTDTVYDIGAGTGSVTCSMALKAHEGLVYGIEKKDAAYELALSNIDHIGCKNIHLVKGEAPKDMEGWKPADKVFIGGSTGRLGDIISLCLRKNHKTVFVVTAITLETLAQSIECFKREKMEYTITSASLATAKKVGPYNMMMGQNPVYIIRGEKIEE